MEFQANNASRIDILKTITNNTSNISEKLAIVSVIINKI